MSTQTVQQDGILPFRSRLFQPTDSPLIAEITELQAQAWNMNLEQAHFHVCLCSGDLGVRIKEIAGGPTRDDLLVLDAPIYIGDDRKFSIAVSGITDPKLMDPVAVGTFSMGLRETGPITTLSLRIEDAGVIGVNRDHPAQEMLCAAASDFLYDELYSLHRQAMALKIRQPVSVRIVSDSDAPRTRSFTAKLRREAETIRQLFGTFGASPEQSGIEIARIVSISH